MQIIINIPKYVYDTIVASDGYIADCDNEKVGIAVKDGTSLPNIFEDIKADLWMEGMNMTGEYQGVWVRFKNIDKVFDKYISKAESEDNG